MPAAPHLVAFSPHLDDAIISAAGTLHVARRRGWDVTLVTVFAGDAILPLTPAARRLHRIWNLGLDAPAARRIEDRSAASSVGASVIHCKLPDAVYREASDDVFRRELTRHDHDLLNHSARILDDVLQQLRPTLVLGPVGTGRHVDHTIVALACDRLEAHGYRPIYRWIDQPYSWRVPPDPEAARIRLDDDIVEAKLASIACYPSQLSIVFDRDDASWEDDVRTFGRIEYFIPAHPPIDAVRLLDGAPR